MSEHAQSNEKSGEIKLHHELLALPEGKTAGNVVGERHEMVLLIEVAKSNPNGDPDTGNMPRLQPDTMKGLMTDVCLKRKIRNFLSLHNPDGSPRSDGAQDGHHIFIREGAVLQEQIEDAKVKDVAERLFKEWLCSELPDEQHRKLVEGAISGTPVADKSGEKLVKEIRKRYQAAWDGKKQKRKSKASGDSEETDEQDSEENAEKKGKGKKQDAVLDAFDKAMKHSQEHRERAWRDALCQTYCDVRYFGGVVSTEGPLKGSFYGQIRGPIQFGFAESLDRILQLDFSITRCAVASEKEKKQSQGDENPGGDETGNRTMGRKHMVDYGIYRCHIYLSPAFAAKTGFTYYDLDNFLFALKHMFTDDKAAARTGMRVVGLVDFQHSSALGNEHAHKLFSMVKIQRADAEKEKPAKDFPQSIADYCGEAPEGTVREKDEGGEGKELVTARKIVWEIPACPKKPADQK